MLLLSTQTAEWQWSHAWECVKAPGLFFPCGIVLAVVPFLSILVTYGRARARKHDIVSKLRQATAGAAVGETWASPTRGYVFTFGLLLLLLLGFATAQALLFQSALTAAGLKAHHAGYLELLDRPWARAAVLGFAGSYFYLWTEIITRFRMRDLSDEVLAAMNRGLVIGPMLAGFVSFLGIVTQGGGYDLAAFVLGAFPGLADDYINRIARKVLTDTRTVAQARPLQNIAGMTLPILDRLAEGGYTDAQHLAYANPYFLVATLPYGVKQILDWVDEALLYRYLSEEAFQNRSKAGLTGAIDLLMEYHRLVDAIPVSPPATTPTEAEIESILTDLANQLGVEPSVLRRTCQAMDLDQHVVLVTALYNSVAISDVDSAEGGRAAA